MKKIYFFLLFLVFIPGFLFSQEEINLKYSFRNNDTYIVTTNISSQSIQEVADKPQDVSTVQNIVYTVSFSKNPENQNYNILLKFKNITSEINQSGYKQLFSSDSSHNEMSKIFRNFLSKNLNFQLTEKGNIIPLYTIDKLFPDTFENNQKFIFSQSVEQKVKADLPVSITFPEHTVKIGDTWNISDTISVGIFNFYNKKYTLDSVSKTEYFITENADFSSDKNNLIPMNRVFVSYDVTGKTVNHYISNRKSCFIKSAVIRQTGTGNVQMKYTKNSDPAYTWKMTINNEVILTGKKLKID